MAVNSPSIGGGHTGQSQNSQNATMDSTTSFSSSYQSISYQDEVKCAVQDKLSYLSDIFRNQSDLVQNFEWENRQLKLLVHVLLHFKHMFLFVTKAVDFQNLTSLTHDLMINTGNKKSSLSYDEAMLLKTDLDHCLAKYSQLVKSANFDFVQEKDTAFYRTNQRYQPYREDLGPNLSERLLYNNNRSSIQNKQIQRKRQQACSSKNHNNNNSDVRSSISSSSSSIEVFEPISFPAANRPSIGKASNSHSPVSSLQSYHSQNNVDSHNSTADFVGNSISQLPNNSQQQQNDVILMGGDGNNRDEVQIQDLHRETYNGILNNEILTDENPSFQDQGTSSSSFGVNSDQMEMNLNEDDVYFTCSFPDCLFRSKSWTQVQAHEFRRHKSIKEEILEPEPQEDLDLDPTRIPESSFGVTTCTICKKQFKTCEMYMTHIDKWHIQGDYRCQSLGCTYVAPYRIELTRHSKRVHCNATRRKTHPCSWPDCGKSFTSITLLKNHLRVHLKYKRFRCKWPNCAYASEQDSNVIRHIRIRHFKLPITVKEQIELNISHDQNPHDFMEVMPEDVVV